jgi:hypothetical protein
MWRLRLELLRFLGRERILFRCGFVARTGQRLVRIWLDGLYFKILLSDLKRSGEA